MPSDMRDELVSSAEDALRARFLGLDREVAEVVIDSIPPGSFKNEKGEWVRLSDAGFLDADGHYFEGAADPRTLRRLYTEVDHAE